MLENIALLASATWLITAIIKGIAARWVTLSGPDTQGVALFVAIGFTMGGYYTGFIAGDVIEVVLTLIIGLFGANLVHDKLESPVREAFTKE